MTLLKKKKNHPQLFASDYIPEVPIEPNDPFVKNDSLRHLCHRSKRDKKAEFISLFDDIFLLTWKSNLEELFGLMSDDNFRNRRMSWMGPAARDLEREKLEGSLLTVCTDCKDMVLQVNK